MQATNGMSYTSNLAKTQQSKLDLGSAATQRPVVTTLLGGGEGWLVCAWSLTTIPFFGVSALLGLFAINQSALTIRALTESV